MSFHPKSITDLRSGFEKRRSCRRAYLDACSDLQSLVGLDPSEANVLDTIGADEVPECFLVWKDYAASWPKAVEIRRELERECLVS